MPLSPASSPSRLGSFEPFLGVHHLGKYNVTVDHSSPGIACRVDNGVGNATDDVYNVRIVCGRGQFAPQGVSGGGGGHGGSVAAAILVPLFVLGACGGVLFLAVRRGGGNARQGLASLAADARNLPASLPPLQIPFAAARQPMNSATEANPGDWTAEIPQAQLIDPQTGAPVVPAQTPAHGQ